MEVTPALDALLAGSQVTLTDVPAPPPWRAIEVFAREKSGLRDETIATLWPRHPRDGGIAMRVREGLERSDPVIAEALVALAQACHVVFGPQLHYEDLWGRAHFYCDSVTNALSPAFFVFQGRGDQGRDGADFVHLFSAGPFYLNGTRVRGVVVDYDAPVATIELEILTTDSGEASKQRVSVPLGGTFLAGGELYEVRDLYVHPYDEKFNDNRDRRSYVVIGLVSRPA
jgi:hypothetical protein